MDQKSMLLDELKKHKSICWYPSVGSDFRPLLYLSKPFYEKHEELSAEDAAFPDLFIMTDYRMPGYINYGDDSVMRGVKAYVEQNFDKLLNGTLKSGDVLFNDYFTCLTIKSIRRIFLSDIEPQKDLINENISSYYGQGYYMRVKIDSGRKPTKELGTWETDVVYLCAENTVFAKKVLLQNQINIDYIVRVLYGDRRGGGSVNSGYWLFYLADLLKVKYYVSNPVFKDALLEDGPGTAGDKKALQYLIGDSDLRFEKTQLTPLYRRKWYKNEPVIWYRVKKESESIVKTNKSPALGGQS